MKTITYYLQMLFNNHFTNIRSIVLTGLLVWITFIASAQLPTGFVVNNLTGNTINEGVAMAHAPDGRIFIIERSGNLKVYKDNTVTLVHTVETTTAVEQGLLGMALHTDFATNGKLYLYYTNTASTRHYLDMLVIEADNDVASETRIMEFDPIINGFHNGGAMVFKGIYLYICIGESNTPAEAPKLDTYMGKVLRLLENGQPAPGNPYYSELGASRQKKSIWAIGMRNPWYMTKDPVTDKLYVINVGGNYEEVNDVTNPDATKNYDYGWAGNGLSGPDQPNTTIYPTYAYGHNGWGCAITSGVAFNPTGFTTYPNAYKVRLYFTDWCSGWLRSFDMSNPATTYQEFSASDFGNVLGLSLGIDGNIYYFKYGGTGSLNRLEYTILEDPIYVNHPQSKTVYAQDPVTFSVTVSGAATLTYQWYKGTNAIPGATASTYTIKTVDPDSAGTYHCVTTNSFSATTSNDATLTVLAYNARPVATIITPATTLKWNVHDVINFSGSATDAEDGTLPKAAFVWEVQLFHQDCPTCTHWHPGPAAPSGVKSGSFTADNGGETSSNIWIRLILKVTDSDGREGRDTVDLYPNKVTLSLKTNKTGLSLALGGTAVAPFDKVQVVKSAATIAAPTAQIVGDSLFTFVSWDIGGNATQTITVPSTNKTYTATYTSSYIAQKPYGNLLHLIPGTVQIEDYDLGGEGVAYHDVSNTNQGGQYRTTENVDLENCAEGGYNTGYVANGEWLEYTLNVAYDGTYTILTRVASPNTGRTAHLDLDGVTLVPAIAVPNTGGFQNWQTVSTTGIALTKGVHVLRMTMDGTDFNVNYLKFEVTEILSAVTSPDAKQLKFEAFPNPTDNTVELSIPQGFITAYSITLQNAQGKTEWVKSISGNSDFSGKLDLSSQAAGMYFIHIRAEDFVQTIKVIRK